MRIYEDEFILEGEIETFIGLYFQFPLKIELPCGQVIMIKDFSDIKETLCPCGNPAHWVIKSG